MKKIFLLLFVACFAGFSNSQAFAVEIDLTKEGRVQGWVSEVGFKILNANRIDKRVVFHYKNDSKTVNAWASTGLFGGREIVICKGLLVYFDSEDELAAVLSHEISHILDSYNGIMRGSFSHVPYMFAPRKYEYKSDKRAIDFMVAAGYNPVAFIVAMNKFSSQHRFDPPLLGTHPLTSRRLMEMYEYIYKKYPAYLADNAYKNNIYYQNFLLTSTANRAKFQEKVKSNSTKSVKYL